MAKEEVRQDTRVSIRTPRARVRDSNQPLKELQRLSL